MTVLQNGFESGSNGATLTAANTGDGTTSNVAFDTVTIGSGATSIFDSTYVAHGLLSWKVTTPGTGVTDFVQWSTQFPLSTQAWFRVYAYMPALPTHTIEMVRMRNATNNQCCALILTTSGTVEFEPSTATGAITSVTVIPANQWFRVEGYCIGSTTNGSVQFQLFVSGQDSVVPDEVQTSGLTLNTNGQINDAQWGVAVSASNVTMWYGSVGISNEGYMGPITQPPLVAVPTQFSYGVGQATATASQW